ncbi:MAG: 16S rRNA (cytidine(1402)-2'-O)-methyltransferase, partial [Bryobacteraceae bacterium]
RILDSLADIELILGSRPLVIARELTKLHEEFLRGTAQEVRAVLTARPVVKGEITLLIGKAVVAPPGALSVAEAVASYRRDGLSRMDAIKAVASDRGLSKRDVYREVETHP